jgi:hypothetical protein
MAYIISKRDGPRKEDITAKNFIKKNRASIDAIASHLTQGHWGQQRNPLPEHHLEPAGKLWFAAPRQAPESRPYVRISINRRVVVVDLVSGRQLHLLGQIRGAGQEGCFVLATQENGFLGSLEAGLRELLADMDRTKLPDESAEECLKQEISSRLGLASSGDETG